MKRRIYERERADLARGARITTFVHIFAVRNVEDALRKRGRDMPTSMSEPAALPAD